MFVFTLYLNYRVVANNNMLLFYFQECCYQMPNGEDGQIHPHAALWKKTHREGIACSSCPSCLSLQAMSKLAKICCHPALLQVTLDPDTMDSAKHGELEIQKVRDDFEFAKVALPPDVLRYMPGQSCVHQPGIQDDALSPVPLSGKIEVLAKLCTKFKKRRDR